MTYHKPTDLASALDIVASGTSKIIAGGTDIYPALRQGEQPESYLDVKCIAGFAGISLDQNSLRIGAATTWADVIKTNLPPAFDALKQAAQTVGSVQIQNAATIAGNICNASPAADGVPPLMALNAQVELCSAERGCRVLPLSDFIKGSRQTALASDELITAVVIPPIADEARSAFEKLGSRKYLVISISMVAAVITCDASGLITDARISVGSCSPVAMRLPQLEKDVIGKRAEEVKVAADHLSRLSPITDVRGSRAYRLDVVATQCERAIRRACA
ncbi:MAG: FAD binding domain-containing protein [Litoreibacter sp.]|uniref:FAD binding domain-containing protein n=1 Tax=Litoreibacter sp. TaxID=1969459 RepID=UPI0032980817